MDTLLLAQQVFQDYDFSRNWEKKKKGKQQSKQTQYKTKTNNKTHTKPPTKQAKPTTTKTHGAQLVNINAYWPSHCKTLAE